MYTTEDAHRIRSYVCSFPIHLWLQKSLGYFGIYVPLSHLSAHKCYVQSNEYLSYVLHMAVGTSDIHPCHAKGFLCYEDKWSWNMLNFCFSINSTEILCIPFRATWIFVYSKMLKSMLKLTLVKEVIRIYSKSIISGGSISLIISFSFTQFNTKKPISSSLKNRWATIFGFCIVFLILF